jgi:hypothetical protein
LSLHRKRDYGGEHHGGERVYGNAHAITGMSMMFCGGASLL